MPQLDLWKTLEADPRAWGVIPTNREVYADRGALTGAAIMGRGLAKDAALRYPELPYLYGNYLRTPAPREAEVQVCLVYLYEPGRLILLPTKHRYREAASLTLIEDGLLELVVLAQEAVEVGAGMSTIWFPRIGCGLGGLSWRLVRRSLDNFSRHAPVPFGLLEP